MLATRLGIDVGGTFTDFVLMNEEGSDLLAFKTPSTPEDPAEGIGVGLRAIMASDDVEVGDIRHFVHGTTLGVNTIIQRTGASSGLLVTKGFRDILEIGRLRLPDPTNYFVEKTAPIIPRHLVREIDERMSSAGEVITPLSRDEVERAVRDLAAQGVDALAICFLHSYRTPEHERLAAEIARKAWPRLHISLSSEVWPEQREFERASVAVMDAYIGRKLDRYFVSLAGMVRSLGMNATPLTTRSNGGVMTSEAARRSPVATLLSGPASGAVGALFVGQRSGSNRLIALDIGGTSAEACVIDGRILYSTESSVGGNPVVMPAVDISSIGAGGGSIVWLDNLGVLKVGPRSAGAAPGPACYGAGGKEPTLTDAYVELGMVNPETFLGGRLRLDPTLAHKALSAVGARCGRLALEVATGAVEVATATMVAQLMPLLARKGVDPREFTLIAYGGAGPTHALILAREIGFHHIIIPSSPGTLCALGCLVADLKHDAIRTINVALANLTASSLEADFADVEARCTDWIASENVPLTELILARSADMRYMGQSFEVEVEIASKPITALGEVRRLFHETHRRVYGFADEAAPVEIVNVRSTVIGVTSKPVGRHRFPPPVADQAPPKSRLVHDPRGDVVATVLSRSAMTERQVVSGPTVLEADDTTVYVPAGYTGTVDAFGSLVLDGDVS